MTNNLESLIFIALGEASMCWSDIDKAGVFETERCAEVGRRLVSEINSVLKPQTSEKGNSGLQPLTQAKATEALPEGEITPPCSKCNNSGLPCEKNRKGSSYCEDYTPE